LETTRLLTFSFELKKSRRVHTEMHVSWPVEQTGIDKMRERRSQAPFEFLQAHFKILTF
jgi:hypothetical protein